MSDSISRQAAIELAMQYCPDDDGSCSKADRDIRELLDDLENLPFAQPDIIVCADCKHHSHDAGYGRDWCNRLSGVFSVKPDDYCSRAERRTDER